MFLRLYALQYGSIEQNYRVLLKYIVILLRNK